MWAFFSSRLRTWLLFAIAIPIVRSLVHRFSVGAAPATQSAVDFGAVAGRLDTDVARQPPAGQEVPRMAMTPGMQSPGQPPDATW
jgi:hypothetical protein